MWDLPKGKNVMKECMGLEGVEGSQEKTREGRIQSKKAEAGGGV